MSFEDQLARHLRETGEEFTPGNLNELVTLGVADGRKRRRRRSAAIVGGSAALALIAVGGALAPSLLSTSQQHAQAANGSPKVGITQAAQPVSDKVMAQKMAAALVGLMPKNGTVSNQKGSWSRGKIGDFVSAGAQLDFKDAQGRTHLGISLERTNSEYQRPSCPPVLAYVPNDVCHSYKLADGGFLLIDQGYEYPSKGTGTKDWHATLVRPNGVVVELDQWNSMQEKDAPISRPNPVLGPDQMKALVEAPVWQTLGVQMPVPKPLGPGQPPQGPSALQIINTIKSLLPAGVHTLNASTMGTGYGDTQLKDGHPGVGLLGINVQQWDLKKDASVIGQLYGGGTKLPDGSWLAIRQSGAEKGGAGAVQWVVDLMRPNGQRVVAMEFNAPRQGQAADRSAPVLTIDQLKALVISPLWKSLG